MKVLVSAYSCHPSLGSEPGIGWNWTLQAAKNHDVCLLTWKPYAADIESVLSEQGVQNVSVVGLDVRAIERFWKRIPGGQYIHYLAWQGAALGTARRLHREHQFDVGHHITFGSMRFPSFLPALGIPYVWGPVGGAEAMPRRFWRHLRNRDKAHALLRILSTRFARFDPMVKLTACNAAAVLVTTAETGEQLPICVGGRQEIIPATGLDSPTQARSASTEVNRLRLLYVGRLVYWKGVQFAIEAVTDAIKEGLPVSLTIVGRGALESRLKRLVAERGMERRISFMPWLPREELGVIYSEHDAFIFPSFQDSGGSAVLEAMSHGLPVICLEVGGPGISVDHSSGFKVAIRDESQLLGDLRSAIETLFRDPGLRASMEAAARERSIVEFGWDRLEQVLNSLYLEAAKQHSATNRPRS